MKLLLILLCLLVPRIDVPLLESGQGTTLRKLTSAPAEIKVLSYNIRWRSGEDLKDMIKLLKDDPEIGGALILALQEVDRNKKRSGHNNTAKLIADELGLYYAWAAPPTANPTDEEETGVALLSVYALSDLKRIVLPHPGPGRRRRVALGATVEIEKRQWRVYSAHAETRIKFDKKLEQFKAVIEDLSHYPASMPAIIMGDFNTWEPNAHGKVTKLFSDAGFKTPFVDGKKTFKRRILFVPLELKLDWVWLRGLEAASCGIDREIGISDHYPLWTNVKMLNR
ncbi:MAG TPA: endonuclease/exonuclease/phosphatase family protein [Pyrinomonadaceae bacterium]|jgi:endonuclease/exonuclease/phosphatase family metal-dependent hydrolase|nr:endonuclease/exonuclease/phosphatase family protein [Pyrinomonadaceae bacterium]